MREDTQKAIKEYKISVSFSAKSIESAEEFLSDNEKVLFVSPTNFGITYKDPTKKNACIGVVFLTDKRMLLYYKIHDEVNTDVTTLNEIEKITLISNPMTAGNRILVQAGDRIYNFSISVHMNFKSSASIYKDMLKVAMIFEYARDEYGKKISSENNGNNNLPDVLEQIEKLSELKDKGIVSEEEFQAKKAELLSRL